MNASTIAAGSIGYAKITATSATLNPTLNPNRIPAGYAA